MPPNKLPRIINYCTPEERRNQGRPVKRILAVCEWNGLTIVQLHGSYMMMIMIVIMTMIRCSVIPDTKFTRGLVHYSME